MIKDAKALVTGPGRYEGLSPFQAWLCENVDQCTDQSSGDVESPTGWFAQCGRHVVTIDSAGFHYVTTYSTRAAATAMFEQVDVNYCAWLDDADDEEPAGCTARLLNGAECGAPLVDADQDRCALHIGGLREEIRYAESFADDGPTTSGPTGTATTMFDAPRPDGFASGISLDAWHAIIRRG